MLPSHVENVLARQNNLRDELPAGGRNVLWGDRRMNNVRQTAAGSSSVDNYLDVQHCVIRRGVQTVTQLAKRQPTWLLISSNRCVVHRAPFQVARMADRSLSVGQC